MDSVETKTQTDRGGDSDEITVQNYPFHKGNMPIFNRKHLTNPTKLGNCSS